MSQIQKSPNPARGGHLHFGPSTKFPRFLVWKASLVAESIKTKELTIPTNLITIPGYHEPVRRDRYNNVRNGGGVLIYITENFGNCFCKRPVLNNKPLDAIAPDVFSSYGFTQII